MDPCGYVQQAVDDTLVVFSIYVWCSLQLIFKSSFVGKRSGSGVCLFHPDAFDDSLDVFGLSEGDGTGVLTGYFQA